MNWNKNIFTITSLNDSQCFKRLYYCLHHKFKLKAFFFSFKEWLVDYPGALKTISMTFHGTRIKYWNVVTSLFLLLFSGVLMSNCLYLTYCKRKLCVLLSVPTVNLISSQVRKYRLVRRNRDTAFKFVVHSFITNHNINSRYRSFPEFLTSSGSKLSA